MEPCNEVAREGKYFKPPLWRQRRSFAVKAIKQSNTESVADFGCGEGALLEVLLNSCQFSRIAGVDIDTQALSSARVLCRPRDDDFRYLRELPLRLSLYHGSNAKLDARLQDYECITMLEVIEHMELETLEMVSRSVFGGYQPKMVIISTPNAEFNVNFKNLYYGTPQSQFRHWDHRFEWTRQEFNDWCTSICNCYEYDVEISGVGLLNVSDCDVGFCSQIATFTRKSNRKKTIEMDFPLCSVYEIDYPYYARTDISDVEILDMLVEKTELLLAPGAERVIFISEIWNVLEIRQLCKQYGKLLKFLEADAAKVYFEVQGDKVKLLKAGPILMHEFENDQGQKTDETPEILPFVEVYSLRVLDDDAGERALGWD